MPISKERLASLIAETETVEKAFHKLREEIRHLLDLEQREPSTRESMISVLNYSLATNPVPALVRKEVEKHHYFLTRKDNERKKLYARRKRAGASLQEDRDRETRLKDDLDFFVQHSPARGAVGASEGGEALPSADEGFPALDVEDL